MDFLNSDLKPLLTPEVVTELVIAGMRRVPPTLPSTFGSSYTPIAAAGTESQVGRKSGVGKLDEGRESWCDYVTFSKLETGKSGRVSSLNIDTSGKEGSTN